MSIKQNNIKQYSLSYDCNKSRENEMQEWVHVFTSHSSVRSWSYVFLKRDLSRGSMGTFSQDTAETEPGPCFN